MENTISDAIAGKDDLDSTTVQTPQELSDLLETISQPEWDPSASFSVKGLRIGLPKEYLSEHMDSEVVDVWDHVADVLSSAGAQVSLASGFILV